jgi:Kef-type K+ transport system membrane component KefB
MEQPHGASALLLLPVLLLAVAVVSVPLARLLRLSAIVAYLAAGVVIGPYGSLWCGRPKPSSQSPSLASYCCYS